MAIRARLTNTGGCCGTRQAIAMTALLLFPFAVSGGATQSGNTAPLVQPTVREQRGVYTVSAEFTAAAPAHVTLGTLTDYENIPRFMPAVRTSTVAERGDGYALLEQEAIASFMMFSKRIHLTLEVREAAGVIRFIDRCGKSFERYEGSWTVTESGGRSLVVYRLTAKPSFEVPGFLLKRLLKRDAIQMIESLQSEIAARYRFGPSVRR
jgi:hypothetical protein